MHKVIVNKKLNRLTMTLSGKFDISDARTIVKILSHRVNDLEPGFEVINDIRFVKIASIPAALMIKKGTAVLEEHGARVIIRVVGGSSFSLKLFAKFSRYTSKTKIYFVPTLEDAEEKLKVV